MAADPAQEYASYLERFAAAIPDETEVGGFAKYKGKLIKKLGPEEFAKVSAEYHSMASHYFESLDRGDTINDLVVRTIRDNAAILVLTSPV